MYARVSLSPISIAKWIKVTFRVYSGIGQITNQQTMNNKKCITNDFPCWYCWCCVFRFQNESRMKCRKMVDEQVRETKNESIKRCVVNEMRLILFICIISFYDAAHFLPIRFRFAEKRTHTAKRTTSTQWIISYAFRLIVVYYIELCTIASERSQNSHCITILT